VESARNLLGVQILGTGSYAGNVVTTPICSSARLRPAGSDGRHSGPAARRGRNHPATRIEAACRAFAPGFDRDIDPLCRRIHARLSMSDDEPGAEALH
jgi:hypothetical protein